MNEDHFNFSGRDWRDLSPQQWAAAKRDIICRAHQMRSHALRAVVAVCLAGLVRALRFVRDSYKSWKTVRLERDAIARLQSLDDHALSDIGIRRSEIESVVHADGGDITRRCRGNGNRPITA